MSHYRIELPVFEGPMDLLLYLIKRNELDIYDIPISLVTQQYIEYLNMMRLLNVSLASEFLVMAATLMFIKSRMMLPPAEEEGGEGASPEDPRAPLIQQLLEYQHFREIALHLEERATAEENVFYRWMPLRVSAEEVQEEMEPLDLFGLYRCFLSILERQSEAPFEIGRELISVEEKKEELLAAVAEKEKVIFWDYVSHRKLAEIIAIFVALLDLVKNGRLRLRQVDSFGPIEVYR